MNYTCPAGHEITASDNENVECHPCRLIATHLSRRDGEVFNWTPRGQFDIENEALQDAMDGAFDHQYGFDEF